HPPHGPLAPAYAIVNPQQDGDESGENDLSGVGVAFRLAEVLLAASQSGAALLPQLLELVAIGTIADVVPMSPSNWALVRAGLHQINEAPRAGIRALLAMARLRPGDVGARDISFALAPRINACGRMGRPDLAMALMLAVDAAEADELAREVETLNAQRQAITDEIVAKAREQAATQIAARANVVVTQGDRWPLGVLGLVAGRLAEEYRRPAFVISRDGLECRGSARSPVGVDLGAILAARSELFTRFGGHARAAGFTIPTQTLPPLLAYLEAHFAAQDATGAEIEDGDRQGLPPVVADCRLPLRRLIPGSTVYDDLETLEPFGPGFAEPVFLCPGARILGCRRSGVEGRTLRLRLAHGGVTREFVWSRRGDICDMLRSTPNGLPPMDVAFTLRKYHRSASGSAEWLPHIETLAPAES
ncbi:MAG TPA: DHHA1 domain-containing protein, partial [Ktedonobacterales bacterium]|nr:DHHA1 domain-containing protein [Ktedonobacterales bacterium]